MRPFKQGESGMTKDSVTLNPPSDQAWTATVQITPLRDRIQKTLPSLNQGVNIYGL